MIEEHNGICIFRDVDATTLLIFERDGTLLPSDRRRSIFLSDINAEIVEVARQIRKLGIPFGFISGKKTMERSTRSKSQAAALIKILDQILSSGDAAPDFWMAWPTSPYGSTIGRRDDGLQMQSRAMIMEVMRWYAVKKTSCVFVSSSPESLIDAAKLGVKTVRYIPPMAAKFPFVERSQPNEKSSHNRRAEELFEKIANLASL